MKPFGLPAAPPSPAPSRPAAPGREEVAAAALPPLPVQIGLIDTTLIKGQPATLRLFVTNATGAAIPLGSQAPTFKLSFLTASTPGGLTGALATVSAVRQIKVALAQEPAGITWEVHSFTSGAPSWQLAPAGTTLLGAGAQATVVFDIADVTAAAAGMTTLTVAYTGTSTYSGGSVTLPLIKLTPPPAPQIVSFTATSGGNPVTSLSLLDDPDPTITLSFEVANAQTVSIAGADYVAPGTAGPVSIDIPIQRTTTYTLVASNSAGQSVSQSLTVTVSPDLFDLLPAGSILIWSQDLASIPAGWGLCNGSGAGGVTMVSEYFPVGAGNQYEANRTYAATAHSHAYPQVNLTTGLGGAHGHPVRIFWYATESDTGSCQSAGGHGHSVSAQTTFAEAGGQAPPAVGLTYIMKTS